jgi:hypothetical protein
MTTSEKLVNETIRNGIRNVYGGNCFMSSTFQFLASMSEFLDIFNVNREVEDLNEIEDINIKNGFINFRKILRHIYNLQVLDTEEMKSAINNVYKLVNPNNYDGGQESSDEFLMLMLNNIRDNIGFGVYPESLVDRLNVFYSTIDCEFSEEVSCIIDDTPISTIVKKLPFILIEIYKEERELSISEYMDLPYVTNEDSANVRCVPSRDKDLNNELTKIYSLGEIDRELILDLKITSEKIKTEIKANESSFDKYKDKYLYNDGIYNKIIGYKIATNALRTIELFYEQSIYSKVKKAITYTTFSKYIIVVYAYKEISKLKINYEDNIVIKGKEYELCCYIYAQVEINKDGSTSGHYVYKYKKGENFATINDSILEEYRPDKFNDPRARTVLLYKLKSAVPAELAGGKLKNYKNKYLKYKAKYLQKKRLILKY